MPTDPPVFIGSEVYRGSSYGRWHPLAVPRVPQVMDLCRALGWLMPGQYRTSPRAKPDVLTWWHTPEYIAALQRAEATQQVSEADRDRHHLGTTANPIYPEMFRRPATSAGGVMLAASLLAQGGVVHCPGGGTHHGFPDRANGFCFLNDPVLAILALKRQGAARVAYVDIDAHHCDGVDHGFRADPSVLVVSLHEADRWPRTGALFDRGLGNLVNLPVPAGFNDSECAFLRDAVILRRVADFRPDAVVLQCGADALLEDPMSRLALSNNAHLAILDGLRPLSPRLMVLGGGGYNPWSVGRLWTRVWGRLAGHEAPEHLPDAAERILSALRWTGLRASRTVEPHWRTTLVDAPRNGPIRPEILQMAATYSTTMV
ncbi:acetoin utilization protein AcuC [Fluviibacterium sp. DFM31]|uniref:Acetoin utilization protein AcuC n=1 Tax=Meridianimarinicoccus marinus TaxID=3231483 RepID=A0ABV3L4D9_9RHOB